MARFSRLRSGAMVGKAHLKNRGIKITNARGDQFGPMRVLSHPTRNTRRTYAKGVAMGSRGKKFTLPKNLHSMQAQGRYAAGFVQGESVRRKAINNAPLVVGATGFVTINTYATVRDRRKKKMSPAQIRQRREAARKKRR